MKVHIIASGSRGNCTFLELDGVRLLLDVGVSCRQLAGKLAELNTAPDEIDAVFVTHEHADHTRGLATLLKKYRLPVFTRPDTWRAINRHGAPLPPECFHAIRDKVTVKNVVIDAFSISHDAADPVGYVVCGSRKYAQATDLGELNSAVLSAINGSDVLLLEANHDTELLKRGSYPLPLKKRILSRCGHLDNRTAAEALLSLNRLPEKIYLGHMSEENNRPALARETVTARLRAAGVMTRADLITALPQGSGASCQL